MFFTQKVMQKILIIDDKEAIAKVIANYFKDEYECIYCENPLKGIQWLEKNANPDLIILDLRMPVMSGEEFLNYIKGNELFKQIPVIVLSSEDNSSIRIRLLENGAEDFILKPFNPMELKVRLKKILK